MVQAHEDEEVIIEAGPGDDEAAGGSVSEPGPRTWSSLVKSGAGAAQAGASKQAPAACPKEGTPVFQGDRGGHQKPSGSGYASLRQRASSSQGRSPGQRQSERYSKDTEEANTRPGSEMTVKNG